MAGEFRALRVTQAEGGGAPAVAMATLGEADLMPGNVTVAVRHSTVNYKDGLALTGAAPILRRSPMTPGIDFAGVVTESGDPAFVPGDAVVLNGFGVGETHDGGFAERARVPAEWLVKLPSSLSTADAMAIGTAGYTAALAVQALERAGLEPAQGEVLVTGAAGGVGSVAVALLAAAGYSVVAASRRVGTESAYLRGLGAGAVMDAAELAVPGRPLGKERWAAAIDSVGSQILANALAGMRRGGLVAACGLALGADLPASVMPFILRGVTLIGIDSVYAPMPRRQQAWARLARDLDRDKLSAMTTRVGLDAVAAVGAAIIAGHVRGRTVVEIEV